MSSGKHYETYPGRKVLAALIRKRLSTSFLSKQIQITVGREWLNFLLHNSEASGWIIYYEPWVSIRILHLKGRYGLPLRLDEERDCWWEGLSWAPHSNLSNTKSCCPVSSTGRTSQESRFKLGLYFIWSQHYTIWREYTPNLLSIA